MDPPKLCCAGNPLENSDIRSRATFSWLDSLFSTAKGEKLKLKHLFNTPPSEEISTLGQQLDKEWQKELESHKAGKRASLAKAIARAFGAQFFFSMITVVLQDISRFSQPIILRYLIGYLSEDSEMSQGSALGLASAMAFLMVLQGFICPHHVFYMVRNGMRWQGGTADLLYRKMLKLPQKTLSELTTGHVMSLMTTDAEKLDWVVWTLHKIWKGPVYTVLCVTLMYYDLGCAVFSGVGLLIPLIPLQMMVAAYISRRGRKSSKHHDERVSMMNEIIGGMRVIKMYCWEKPFGEIIDDIRNTELKSRWRVDAMWDVFHEVNSFNRRLLPVIIVLVYVSMDNTLTAAKLFPAIAMFDILNDVLLGEVPWSIRIAAEVAQSAKRIEDFLVLPEEEEKNETRLPSGENNTQQSVRVAGFTATWAQETGRHQNKDSGSKRSKWLELLIGGEEEEDEGTGKTSLLGKKASRPEGKKVSEFDRPPVLKDISFDLSGNKLLAIVGKVGSGKSSLLMSLLGELKPSQGSVKVEGSMSYSAQQPWVFSSTIRQNILFGRTYDPDRYAQVIEAAALTTDLGLMPHGDLSLVGEKGVTLSGGQKARVSLARALYADTDIVLLDDPLSAVDAHVGRHIYDKAINGYLEGKMRILVTHQTQFLKDADNILILDNGELLAFGSYKELVDAGHDLGLVVDQGQKEEGTGNMECDDSSNEQAVIKSIRKQMSTIEQEEEEDEDRAQGSIGWRVYLEYFKSSNNCSLVFLVLLMKLVIQASSNLSDLWLAAWCSSESEGIAQDNTTIGDSAWNFLDIHTSDKYTSGAIFLVITAVTVLVSICSKLSYKWLTGAASRNLHNRMYNSVIRSPVKFYDTTPKGRVLNRFSGDCAAVDGGVPHHIMETIVLFCEMAGKMLIVVFLNPWTLLPILPLSFAMHWLRNQYVWVHREVKRTTAEANSPMLTHMTSTLEGIQTIRAFGVQDQCLKDFHGHYRVKYSGWFTDLGIWAWFNLRNNFIGSLFNGAAIFIVTLCSTAMSPGQAALTLTYVIRMMSYVERAVNNSAETELHMVKAERVIRYTKLEPEAELTSDHPPPEDWPQQGGIVFDRVSLAYKDKGPLALSDLNVSIQPGAKIGIVGRTGAGKSTIIQSLFRLYDQQGEIRIDGLSTNKMGLHELRSKLSIIPQDPVLFKGSVRKNLDPFGRHTDEELWSALEEVQLRSLVEDSGEGMDSDVEEGGGNFSVGQKQLFCLARAILGNNKILIIDEATANVDYKTDEMIQGAIRKKFASCTVLTIAHRLNTILDSDKILVMDKGRCAEFDTPSRLLENTDGHFYKMVASIGSVESLKIAKAKQPIAEVTMETNKEPDVRTVRHRMKVSTTKGTS